MKMKTLKLSAVCIALAGLFPAAAHANGYHFLHQSATGMSTAYATNGTGGNDISAMFSNPASIIRFEGTNFSGGFVLDLPKSRLYNASATAPYSNGSVAVAGTPAEPSQPIDTAYGAATYFTHQLQPDLVVGVAFGAPYAYVSEYPETAVSRYTATRTALTALNLSPNIAYRINPEWAIGGAVNFQYYSAGIDTMVATSTHPTVDTDVKSSIKAKNLALGFSLGFEHQMSADTRIGASFRSSIHHSFRGTSELTGSAANYAALLDAAKAQGVVITSPKGSADFDIATPYMLQVGLLHKLNDQVELYANANRFGWSAFKDTHIVYGNGLKESVVDNNWHDSWSTAVGIGYQYSPQVKIRAGMAYDWTPTPAPTVSPRAPNNNRWNMGTGLSYAMDKDWTFDLAYQYIQFTKVTIALKGGDNEPRGNLSANLDLHANVFMAQINRHF
jgi:long-chain fatty acid transport protein